MIEQKAIVVGVGLKSEHLAEIKSNLAELAELVEAAGADVVGSCFQQLEKFNSATLIGKGKVSEIKELADKTGANLIVIDHKLSGVQSRNLEELFKVGLLDRNQVIIDIFAQRAQTYEGKLQVELAQSLDQMPRMVGAWLGSLSRLGGGIGTRGPGEKAIETDRRTVRAKVDAIRKKLEAVRKSRALHRSARKRNKTPSFALVGYTNSGKSTLLNRLTQSSVLSKDQVFATLDPTTRKVHLPSFPNTVMTDTVGFIRKLPPNLIEAFKATLEESSEADVLLHVIDLSNPNFEEQVKAVNDLFVEFGWNEKPVLHVFNKVDAAPTSHQFKIKEFPRVLISAHTGEGIEDLKSKMSDLLNLLFAETELFFTKDKEHLIFELAREATIVTQEPASQGTLCKVKLTSSLLTKWQDYLVKKEA